MKRLRNTVLNPRSPDGLGSRVHAPEAMHTPGLTFTGGDNATHTGVGGRNLLEPCVLAEDFFSWESGCICIFFLVAAGYQGSVCVHVCACVCERERERERKKETAHQLASASLESWRFCRKPSDPGDASPWSGPQFSFPCRPPRLSVKS